MSCLPAIEPRPAASDRGRAREGGFTMVELGVAMLVLSIIAAIAIPTFSSARKNAADSEFVGFAQSYATAIEAYKLDHAGSVPVLGSPSWPTTAAATGPINTMPGLPVGKQRYLRSGVPAVFSSGRAQITTTPAAARAERHLQYIANGTTSYTMAVTNEGKPCYIGDKPANVAKACGS